VGSADFAGVGIDAAEVRDVGAGRWAGPSEGSFRGIGPADGSDVSGGVSVRF
jgi:hypothetical protein